jgi:hypothetical protein
MAPEGPGRPGRNRLAAKGGHHGMEIWWPGPVVFIQYDTARSGADP